MRPAAFHLLLCILTLPLAACAVDSATAAKLRRGMPAKTVVQTVGQPGHFLFRAQLPDAVYEARYYSVGSADHAYCFVYRNDSLWKITEWVRCNCQSTRPSAPQSDDWSETCLEELHETLQQPDCRSFPPNYNPLLYVAWAGEMTFFIPFAAAITFPILVADLAQEPSYASIVARFDPDRIQLGETLRDLDRQLGPPTLRLVHVTTPRCASDEWRCYDPELPPTSAPPLLFQDAGTLEIQSRQGKVTAVFSYYRY
jgi:hypothetical protein